MKNILVFVAFLTLVSCAHHDQKIKIGSDENLAEFLQKKITENLLRKGFSIGFGKTLEIHIASLEYTAKRKFFIGESAGKIAVTAVVTNNKNQSTLTKNFSSSLDSKHFIAPLESTERLATIVEVLFFKSYFQISSLNETKP